MTICIVTSKYYFTCTLWKDGELVGDLLRRAYRPTGHIVPAQDLKKQPNSPGVLLAQWVENPTVVMEIVGSNTASEDSDFS